MEITATDKIRQPKRMLSNIALLSVVSLATVIADYFIKLAAVSELGPNSPRFILGATLYGLTAIGWYYLMLANSLAKISVMYSCSTIVMLVALGYIVFGERTEIRHLVGAALAILSVIIVG